MQKLDGFIKQLIGLVLIWSVGMAARWFDDPVLLAWCGQTREFVKPAYRKIEDRLSDELTRRVAEDPHWTLTTIHVYYRLIRRIDLIKNRAELTAGDLAKLTGLKSRTARLHVRLLEEANLIAVERSRVNPTRNSVNVYRLCGEYAGFILYTPGENKVSLISTTSAEGCMDFHNGENRRHVDSTKYLNTKTLEQHKNKEQHTTPVVAGEESQSGVSIGEGQEVPQDPGHGEPLPDVPGMIPMRVQQLCDKYGRERVRQVAEAARGNPKIKHVPGYVTDALREGWDLMDSSAAENTTQSWLKWNNGRESWGIGSDIEEGGQRYISGPYADFINH